MAVILDSSEVARHLTDDLVVDAIEKLLGAELEGKAAAPPRLDVDTPRGFLRLMPGLYGDVMGFKVMTLVEGLGTRYLILLFDTHTGRLLAGFDAEEVTRSRTAATTAVACRILADPAPSSLAMLGSGFEARGHLRLFARLFPVMKVWVFSPTVQHRERFAGEMSTELGLEVHAVESAESAVADAPVVVLTTKAKRPVVDGSAFSPEAVVLSIGSTRLDLRELDQTAFERAAWVVGDSPAELLAGSGDVVEAVDKGVLDEGRLVSLAEASRHPDAFRPNDERDLLVFKSMGTATQDLAVASTLYERIRDQRVGTDIGDVPTLKPFSSGG